MNSYEKVFDSVVEEFNNSMFGEYSNSITRDQFQINLMQEGWKYFDLGNLNELFSIKYNQLRDSGVIDEAKLVGEDLSEEFSRPHSRNLSMSLIIEE